MCDHWDGRPPEVLFRYVLLGVTSFGTGCATATPGVYTRVQVLSWSSIQVAAVGLCAGIPSLDKQHHCWRQVWLGCWPVLGWTASLTRHPAGFCIINWMPINYLLFVYVSMLVWKLAERVRNKQLNVTSWPAGWTINSSGRSTNGSVMRDCQEGHICVGGLDWVWWSPCFESWNLPKVRSVKRKCNTSLYTLRLRGDCVINLKGWRKILHGGDHCSAVQCTEPLAP